VAWVKASEFMVSAVQCGAGYLNGGGFGGGAGAEVQRQADETVASDGGHLDAVPGIDVGDDRDDSIGGELNAGDGSTGVVEHVAQGEGLLLQEGQQRVEMVVVEVVEDEVAAGCCDIGRHGGSLLLGGRVKARSPCSGCQRAGVDVMRMAKATAACRAASTTTPSCGTSGTGRWQRLRPG